MVHKHLHIISFDIPYPADYGGVIDVFFKIKALHTQGVRVHLHCFEYGRAHSEELKRYCENVYYYRRELNRGLFLHPLPYIVMSRYSPVLMSRLLQDKHPILFEGLHTCYYLEDKRLEGRKLLVRSHNIEHEYYRNLAKVEKNIFRKIYFRRESAKLKIFEKVLSRADRVLAISRPDIDNLKQRYPRVSLISAFHPYEKVSVRPGQGSFALYHGNLEVGENNLAALYLSEKVFKGSAVPLIIAGKNPSGELRKSIAGNPKITLKANVPTHEIDELIRQAQLNILPTFQATGIKLKLLAALYNGRHCLVNSLMVKNTGLESICSVKDDAAAMRAEAERLFTTPFTRAEVDKRERVLFPAFSNIESITKLIALLQ